jgi:hypothetical protein
VSAYPDDLGHTIAIAEKLLAYSSEGTAVGQYQAGAKAPLQVQLLAAKQAVESSTAIPVQLAEAQEELLEAIAQYRGKVNSGPINDIEKGSYVQMSGKSWMVIDPEHSKLLLGAEDSFHIGSMEWSDNYNDFEFNPAAVYTLAYYLNHDFYDQLGEDQRWIVEKDWNVKDEAGAIRYGTTGSVSAKVGLLTLEEYLALTNIYDTGEGILDPNQWRNLTNGWWLLTPYLDEEEEGKFVFIINNDGHLYYDYSYYPYYVRPVVNLVSGLQIVGGEGTVENPYQLQASDAKELLSVTSSEGTVTSIGGYQVQVDYMVSSLQLGFELSPGAHLGTVTGATYADGGWNQGNIR